MARGTVVPKEKEYDQRAHAVFLEDIAKKAREVLNVPETEKLYLLDDNLSVHKAPIAVEAHQKFNLERLEYPAKSPDFNPPENLFSTADDRKTKMDWKKGPAPDLDAAALRFKSTCEKICKEGAQLKAAHSMPDRLEECIENQGGPTGN